MLQETSKIWMNGTFVDWKDSHVNVGMTKGKVCGSVLGKVGAFFTGTAAITPIREVDGRTIGAGARGPVTRTIQGVFFSAVRGENPNYRGWLTPVR